MKHSWEYAFHHLHKTQILSFPIARNLLCLTSNFALTIVMKHSWKYADIPRAFHILVYAEFGGQREWIMGNWKTENISDLSSTEMNTNKLITWT